MASQELEELIGPDDSRESWASTGSTSSASAYDSSDYWIGNKGCAGCSKASFPNGMHPSQKYHLDGCLSDSPLALRRRRKEYKRDTKEEATQKRVAEGASDADEAAIEPPAKKMKSSAEAGATENEEQNEPNK